MKIIRNYVLDEILTNFWGAFIILTFVMLTGNVFTKMMDLVLNRGVDAFRIIQIFMLSIPFLASFTIPMSFMVAVLLTFGRLSADHEIVALRASGISLFKIIKPVLIASVVLSVFMLYWADQVATQSHFKVRNLSAEIGMQSPAAILEEGVFIKNFKGLVIFIRKIENDVLHNINIYQPQEKGPTRTIIAEKGELLPLPEQNVIKLKLTNGISDEPDSSNPGRFYKLKFGTYFLPLDISNLKFKDQLDKKRKEKSIREIWKDYLHAKSEGFTDHYRLTEINKRLALASSMFVLTLISIPLAIQTRRGEKSVGFALALILGTIYWASFIGVSSLSKTGTFPPQIIMHLPNVFFVILGTILIIKVIRR